MSEQPKKIANPLNVEWFKNMPLWGKILFVLCTYPILIMMVFWPLIPRNKRKHVVIIIGSFFLLAAITNSLALTFYTTNSSQASSKQAEVENVQENDSSIDNNTETVIEAYTTEELREINRQMRLDRDGAAFLEEEREAEEEARKKAEEEEAQRKLEEEKKYLEEKRAQEAEELRKAQEAAAQKAAEEAANEQTQQSQTTYSQPAPAPNYSNPTPAPQPSPEPEPTPAPNNNCHPSYPTYCIPIGSPDLNCPDINASKIVVYQPDPHRLDGDKDGIGCENN